MAQDGDLALSGDLSCNDLTVRGKLVAPGAIVPTLTAPVTLTDPRTTGTTFQGALDFRGPGATNFSGGTRITFRPDPPATIESQDVRWLTPAGALAWSMGNDASGTGGAAAKNWWLFDNTAAIYCLYFQSGQPGDTVGSIRWQGGRVAYDTATNQMTRRVGNVIVETLAPTFITWPSQIGVTIQGSAAIAGAGLNLGFYGTTPIAKPTVTGSRALGFGPGGAGESLLAQLVALGLVIDGTVP